MNNDFALLFIMPQLCDAADASATRQTLCDLVYFVENEGKLRLDTFYFGPTAASGGGAVTAS